jgi:UPF0755 protein
MPTIIIAGRFGKGQQGIRHRMSSSKKWFRRLLLAALLVLLAVVAGGWWWLNRPLPLRGDRVEVSIEPGTTPREVANLWTGAGVDVSAEALYQWFRWSGQARRIRAGSYEIGTGTSPRELLDKMVRGDETLEMLRLIDGWTFRQVRQAIAASPNLKQTIASLSDQQVAQLLSLPGGVIEGHVFPDTYAYSRGVSDITVLRRAVAAMDRHLAAAWPARARACPCPIPRPRWCWPRSSRRRPAPPPTAAASPPSSSTASRSACPCRATPP